jgi:uncharacterized protein (TIGR02231 family)
MNLRTLPAVGIAASLACGLLHLQAQPETLVVTESRIARVTVFPNAANVTRTWQSAVPAGNAVLRLDYLPSGLDAAGLKAEIAVSDGRVLIRDVSLLQGESLVDEHPEVIALKNELETLDRSILEVQQHLKVSEQRVSYAQALMDSFSKGFGTRESGLHGQEAVAGTWSFYESTYLEHQTKSREVKQTLEPLEAKKKELSKAYQDLRNQVARLTSSVEILVEAAASARVSMELKYLVGNAYWQPLYEVRAYPEREKVQVRYQVTLQQNSGEDWNGVELTVSSARASNNTQVPDLYPIRLNQLQPVAPMMMSKREGRMDTMLMAAPAVAEMAMPEFESSFSSYRVTLPQAVNLSSGGSASRSLVAELDLKGDFRTVVAPRVDTQAYLLADVVNRFEMPMAAGQSILFVDDQLVGRSFLADTPVGERIELSLGINENITVEREDGKLQEGNRGVFNKQTRLSRQYFTTVKNHSGVAQQVVVKDQFPVSENEKIVVNAIAPKAQDVKLEPNTGRFSWEFSLPAGATRELETRFDVSHPEDWAIPTGF